MTSEPSTHARAADVVVIGGGILGAATTYHLAAAGHRVVLLERGAVNREGSGTTAGGIAIQAIHMRPDQSVASDSARFLPLQIAASDYWANIEDELEQSVELRRNGGFMVAETPEQVAELKSKHAIEAAAGLATELLDGDAVRRVLPILSPSVLAADWCPLDGYANPLLIGPAYLRAAVRRGAKLHTFTSVTRIEAKESHYVIWAGQESWTAQRVVNVAGPWIAHVAAMAGIRLEMTPVTNQMHVTVRTRPTMECVVEHIGEGLSVKQVTAGQVLIGGGWPGRTIDLNGRSRAAVSSMRSNLALAVRVLPFLKELRILRTWAGPLAATPDEMPVIGEVPGWPGYYVAGGSYSFTLAPLWAGCLVALIEGRPPPTSLSGLGPDRLLTSGDRPGASEDSDEKRA